MFFFTRRKYFQCISHTASLFWTLPTFHSTETELCNLCGIDDQIRRYSVCPTNLPISRTAKIERSTLLHLLQFFHRQICYTVNLLLDKVLFTTLSSTNVWKLIPYMLYQRGSLALKKCSVNHHPEFVAAYYRGIQRVGFPI